MAEIQLHPGLGAQSGYQNTFVPYGLVLAEIARSLVDEPERVKVEAMGSDAGTTYVLTVGPTDLGKVIGKQGRTVKSLRMILSAMSKKSGRGLFLEVRAGGGSGAGKQMPGSAAEDS